MVLPRQHIEQRGIGASEIAAALGLNPYKTPLELWLEKTGQAPGFSGNSRTEWGLDVEPALRTWYVRRHDLAVWVPSGSLFHDVHPWMRATPDGIALREIGGQAPAWDHGFEAKNIGRHSAHRWGEPGTDQVPMEYLLQAQQGMAVTGLSRWVIVACIAGDPPAEYPIERDDDLIAQMVEGGQAFMRLVEHGIEPEVDGSPAWAEYLAEKYPHASEDYAVPTIEDEKRIASLRDVRRAIRDLESMESELENHLKQRIGARAGIDSAVGRITWKPQRGRELVDWESIAVNLAQHAGISDRDLNARIAANTRSAKPSRPFNVPRSWSEKR